MATAKKTTKTRSRSRSRKASAARTPAKAGSTRAAGAMLRETWEAARKSLSAAEAEVEKQVRSLMNGNQAAETLRQLGQRLERERRKVTRELEGRVSALQARLQKERRSLSHLVDETVKGALAALNIPSRQEINALTRKVDELSRKIDGMASRPARPRPAARRKVATPPAASA